MGYTDVSGKRHCELVMNPLTGFEEEILSSQQFPGAVQVTEVLIRCVKSIGEIDKIDASIIRALTVGDRQYCLMVLRQLTFGDRVQATLPCPWPSCGKGVDIDFNLSSIPLTACDSALHFCVSLPCLVEYSVVTASDQTNTVVEFRLPNGGDQEALCAIDDDSETQLMLHLLSRCIKHFGDVTAPSVEWLRSVPAALLMSLEQEMEARASHLALTMDVNCPECKRDFVAPFELQDFFFSELKVGIDVLFREVHYLAFHYHWSERDILSMTRDRRRRYIETLANEIETLNEKAGH
jgi:hypothetical protein